MTAGTARSSCSTSPPDRRPGSRSRASTGSTSSRAREHAERARPVAVTTDSPRTLDVVIAGGGVAGLEALQALAADRVRLTLIAPDAEFSYRPLAVAEPFALGHAHGVPLSRFREEVGG